MLKVHSRRTTDVCTLCTFVLPPGFHLPLLMNFDEKDALTGWHKSKLCSSQQESPGDVCAGVIPRYWAGMLRPQLF